MIQIGKFEIYPFWNCYLCRVLNNKVTFIYKFPLWVQMSVFHVRKGL